MGKLEVVWHETEIVQAIDEGSHEVHEKYKDLNPLFLPVLKGGAMYAKEMKAALRRNYPEFSAPTAEITMSTYMSGHKARLPRILGLIPWGIMAGHTPVAQEDIVDSGVTLGHLTEQFKANEIYNLEINSLVNRLPAGPRPVQPDIAHLQTDNPAWFIGWGMNDDDLAGHPYWGKYFPDGGRSLKDIVVSPIR